MKLLTRVKFNSNQPENHSEQLKTNVEKEGESKIFSKYVSTRHMFP